MAAAAAPTDTTPILLTSSPNCMKYKNEGFVFIEDLSSFYTYIIIDNTTEGGGTDKPPYIFAAIKTLGALELTSKHGAILKIYSTNIKYTVIVLNIY